MTPALVAVVKNIKNATGGSVLSTCPNCLSQVLHEDHIIDVSCECGAHFSPFLSIDSNAEHSSPHGATDEAAGKPEFRDFTESEQVFADIRQFGETLEDSAPVQSPVTSALQTQVSVPTTAKVIIHEPPNPSGNLLMTSGDHLEGYQIDAIYQPLSTWSPVEINSEDPLKNAFETLWQKATQPQSHANAVVSVHWTFTPDGTRLLVSGTPVKCRKTT